jgi:hypothetical protein
VLSELNFEISFVSIQVAIQITYFELLIVLHALGATVFLLRDARRIFALDEEIT